MKVIDGTLAASVADAATFTASYPDGTDAGNFFLANGHKLVLGPNNNVLNFPTDFDISLGTDSITVTNKFGATWAAGTQFRLQMNEQGDRQYTSKTAKKVMAAAFLASSLLVDLGAPDALDADGLVTSVALTTVGTAATTVGLTGAVVSGGVATLDVPRNITAALSSAGTMSLTITGKDVYGNAMVEKLDIAAGTSAAGKKAFKTVSLITRTSNGLTDPNLTVGFGDVLGLPFFLPTPANVIAQVVDGVNLSPAQLVRVPFSGTAALLASGGDIATVISPVAGVITGVSYTVMAALAATAAEIGTLFVGNGATNATVGGSPLGSSPADALGGFATGSAIGTTIRKKIANGASASTVAAGSVMYVQAGTSWASAGNIGGYIEIAPLGSPNGSALPGSFVTGLRAADGSNASSGDVRGTYQPGQACDGSVVYQLLVTLPDPGFLGISQYAG